MRESDWSAVFLKMRSEVVAISKFLIFCLTVQISLPATFGDSQFLQNAIIQYNAGQYQEAIGLLGEAESTEFNNPILHYYKANAFTKAGIPAEAIKEYKMTLMLQPDEKIAAYCHEALQSLNEEPHKRTSGKQRNFVPLPEVADHLPEVVALLSDSNVSQRLRTELAVLKTEYGSQIIFVSADKDAPDKQSQALIDRYHVLSYPSVLFFDAQGNLRMQLVNPFEQSELVADLQRLGRGRAHFAFDQSPTALPEKSHQEILNEKVR